MQIRFVRDIVSAKPVRFDVSEVSQCATPALSYFGKTTLPFESLRLEFQNLPQSGGSGQQFLIHAVFRYSALQVETI
jgi:hypothetical protein